MSRKITRESLPRSLKAILLLVVTFWMFVLFQTLSEESGTAQSGAAGFTDIVLSVVAMIAFCVSAAITIIYTVNAFFSWRKSKKDDYEHYE